jgi:hypothetical protein
MCKCKSFTLTQDLHAISMTIDTYTHTTENYMKMWRWDLLSFALRLNLIKIHLDLKYGWDSTFGPKTN